MAYDFYFDKILLPVPPETLSVKINGKNKTVTLINEGEINILKKPGLTEISLTILLPNIEYPFARYEDGFKDASFFLGELEKLKTQTDDKGRYLPFQFIVSRVLPDGKVLFDSNFKNFKVTLEDYEINDDVENGFDISVDIELKEYRQYGTKIVEVIEPPTPPPVATPTPQVSTPFPVPVARPTTTTTAQPAATITVEPQRPAENPPTQQTYTVVKGDSLWAISKKMLGDGNRYPELYEQNKDLIDARNSGTGNTKYTIYPGQVFVIPSK